MSLQLTIGEMLTALRRLGHPQADTLTTAAEKFADGLADLIAETLPEDVYQGPAAEIWDDEVYASLVPVSPTKPIPPALKGLDDDGWD